jgi:hypothetical protein
LEFGVKDHSPVPNVSPAKYRAYAAFAPRLTAPPDQLSDPRAASLFRLQCRVPRLPVQFFLDRLTGQAIQYLWTERIQLPAFRAVLSAIGRRR